MLLAADSFALSARDAFGVRSARAARRKAEVAWATLELLRRHGAPDGRLRRFLRRAAHLFSPLPAVRDAALGELAVALWQQVGAVCVPC